MAKKKAIEKDYIDVIYLISVYIYLRMSIRVYIYMYVEYIW